MGAWLEDLLVDERHELIKEMKALGTTEGEEYQEQLSEVRICERVLRYVQGSMEEAGWETSRTT